jgi:hypothetical protein
VEKNQPKRNEKELTAVQWFRKSLADIRKKKNGKPTDYEPLLKDNGRTVLRRLRGQVLLFRYRPDSKTKFYDRFPIIIVLEVTGSQIIGLNLHYVPPVDRIKLIMLMNSLLYNQKETNLQKTRLKIFSLLSKKIFAKYIGAAVNRYTIKNIAGKPKLTTPEEWSYLAFLPVFKGISPSKLYSEVSKEVRKNGKNN